MYLLFTSVMGIENCGCQIVVPCSYKAEGLIIGVGFSERKLFPWFLGIENCDCVIVPCSNKGAALIIGVGFSERKLFPWIMGIQYRCRLKGSGKLVPIRTQSITLQAKWVSCKCPEGALWVTNGCLK